MIWHVNMWAGKVIFGLSFHVLSILDFNSVGFCTASFSTGFKQCLQALLPAPSYFFHWTPLVLRPLFDRPHWPRAWNRLFHTLEQFGFGSVFIKWIKTIYNSISSSIKVNGWLTAFINLDRGLRQGCALSMPLYILTAEILVINIRANPSIQGLHLPQDSATAKLSQYADDHFYLETIHPYITPSTPYSCANVPLALKSIKRNVKVYGAASSSIELSHPSTLNGIVTTCLTKS